MSFVRHSVVFPAEAEIECQVLRDLPVILNEDVAFILNGVANSFGEGEVTFKRVQFVGILHVIELIHLIQRPGKEAQKIPHSLVVACCRRVRQGRAYWCC